MNKGKNYPRLHLFIGDALREVSPDTPVLLAENMVINPTASRRLEQRVIEHKEKTATHSKNARDLG